MKEVWFISHYSMPPELEQRVKTLKYAEIMKALGYRTKIFSASTIHNSSINLIEGKEKYIEKSYGNLDFVHIKVPSYHGNGISRILNLMKFSKRFASVAKNFDIPDAIVADVNCVNYKLVYKFCKKNGIKFYSDIRDLWPLSIVEYLGFSEKNPIIKYLYSQEKKLYKVSDGVIFSMEGGKQYIIDKGWDNQIDLKKIHHINNGVDIDLFEKNKNEFTMEDVDLDNPNTFKVIYCGSIRVANNLKLLIETVEIMQENTDIKFIIYGDGDERAKLEEYCVKNNFKNVVFKGFINKKFIPYVLSKANANIINVQQTGILKYGCSLNKLFDYMASGKPIVSNLKVNYDLLEKYNCGIATQFQQPELFKSAILSIYNLPQEQYNIMCANAKNGARDFDFHVLTQQLIDIIER